jgi:hypothetical protein
MQTKSATALAMIAAVTASLLFLASATAYAQRSAGPNRPAAVPEDYVITPFGYFHPSCVVHLKDGEKLLGTGLTVEHTDGTTTQVPPCEYPRYTSRGEIIFSGSSTEPPTITHSWVEYSGATTSSSYGEIYATWNVPPTPISSDGQTIFLFPGLEDYNDVVSIIQPVVGWNGDFKNAWGIASWNCCPSGTTDESSPIRVNVGDLIAGTVKSTCSAGTLSCSKWNITTQDVSLNKTTTLSNTPSEGQTFNWAFAGALEVYNVVQCNDYPPNGAETFNVTLYNDEFQTISNPGWAVPDVWGGLTPQCSYGGSATATQTTLDFGTSGVSPWTFSTTLPTSGPCYEGFESQLTYSLDQLYDTNSLEWTSTLSTGELVVQVDISWMLNDSKGNITSGYAQQGTIDITMPRTPVGTPTLALSGYFLEESGCYYQVQENLTGTN